MHVKTGLRKGVVADDINDNDTKKKPSTLHQDNRKDASLRAFQELTGRHSLQESECKSINSLKDGCSACTGSPREVSSLVLSSRHSEAVAALVHGDLVTAQVGSRPWCCLQCWLSRHTECKSCGVRDICSKVSRADQVKCDLAPAGSHWEGDAQGCETEAQVTRR